ncbi:MULTISPECIES: hypothetical protein [Actinoalloteichus]|uniref:Uncharacterized protein n=1 Tax=Actinoalloteichus fjordicus TaxID=1612552 RepID=A0AAC9LAD6_9PSEU|nr:MULTISPECIES: hypothetical protein [Actinoalloteichus]APU13299.1 hypothetical protein UA74_06125 [Actinoalloteichus fjordicus]APU19250.1 hypothetical protein UA75_06130 [Actinoalloteichus sp. GBA129-24]
MTDALTDRLTTGVGVITLALGAALTVAPERTAAILRLGGSRTAARSIGVADLAIGWGLLRSRRRAPWMAARAALNLVLATRYRAEANRQDGLAGAQAGAVGMSALTVFDGTLALRLARASVDRSASSERPSRPR